METGTLTALSPLDGRYADRVQSLRAVFSEFGLIRRRVAVELEWLQALAAHPGVAEVPAFSEHATRHMQRIVENFGLRDAERVKHIESGTNHDVKSVEYFLRERFRGVAELERVQDFLHFACTSEDINNLAYALMLRDARSSALLPQIDEIIASLTALAHEQAARAMLARTHGQSATPTTVGKEMANFAHRLRRQRTQLAASALLGKMNGAVGNYNAHTVAYPEIDWQALAQEFVQSMGLEFNPYTTQIEPHDYMSEYFAIVRRSNTVLIDFCRDMWGYIALGYFTQKVVAGEVGSSTMPHKVNPIDFENAEGNLGVANALLQHLESKLPVSRWQRDLTDSTVLRNVGVALGHSVVGYQSCLRGLSRVAVDEAALARDLDQAWEVLAEAIQTVMRRHGLPEPYEQLKQLTRGQAGITPETLGAFIDALALPETVRDRLRALCPATYLGNAVTLALRI